MNLNGKHKGSVSLNENLDHHASVENPLCDDSFSISDETKIELIKDHFEEILQVIGLDLIDDSLKDTPSRIAKMYIMRFSADLIPRID